MAKGADRIFIDVDIKEHFIGLLSDADKRWGIQFVNDDVLPVSLNEDASNNDHAAGIGYVAVRGQRGTGVIRNENDYY